LENLKNLELSSNSIGIVESGAFNNLNQLEKLGLRGCGLTELPEEVFFPLGELQYLDLSDNEITSLPEGIFNEN